MSVQSIASNFNRYFKIHVVNNMTLSRVAHKIRHDVYCKELGWEPTNIHEQEVDMYDPYSHHCLLQHRRSGIFAGCVRLITPPKNDYQNLPCFQHYPSGLFSHLNKKLQLPTDKIGEISRLAVTEAFRRRKSEKDMPFPLTADCTEKKIIFSKDEMRNFSYIATGLYLSAMALGEINNTSAISVTMEPKLNKRLERTGFKFDKLGDDIELNGTRATYIITQPNYSANLCKDFLDLYEVLYQDIYSQIMPPMNVESEITMSA